MWRMVPVWLLSKNRMQRMEFEMLYENMTGIILSYSFGLGRGSILIPIVPNGQRNWGGCSWYPIIGMG